MKREIRRYLQRFGVHLFSNGSLPPGVNWLLDLKKLGVPDDAIFFDVGANIGQTVFDIRETVPNARIYSFEPIGETFSTLRQRTEQLPGVRCFPVALGAVSTTLEVCKRGDSVLNSLKPPKDMDAHGDRSPRETVTVKTVDLICQSEGVSRIDVLKTDTEGYDLEVLKGAEALLDQGRVQFVYSEATFCAENTQNTPFLSLFEYLAARNFRFLGLYETYPLHHFPEPNHFCNALFMRK